MAEKEKLQWFRLFSTLCLWELQPCLYVPVSVIRPLRWGGASWMKSGEQICWRCCCLSLCPFQDKFSLIGQWVLQDCYNGWGGVSPVEPEEQAFQRYLKSSLASLRSRWKYTLKIHISPSLCSTFGIKIFK